MSKIAKPGVAPQCRPDSMSPHKALQKSTSVDVSNVKARVDTGKLILNLNFNNCVIYTYW